ncbi:MAG: MBL fold metallo-hydrolase [Bacteroidota bacterium]
MVQRANHQTNTAFHLPLTMPLKVAALNSGSNGNCYWFGSGEEAILVDAGLSCTETEKRMERLGIHMDQVKALLITHEHSDHVLASVGC